MAIKILCTGDIHLGRCPSGLPKDIPARRFAPSSALAKTVDLARRESVDIVVLTGDVVDEANNLFEAYWPLSKSVQELTASGIRVLGIAGNHDFQALGRLSQEISGFRLLAKGNLWDEEIISLGGKQALRVQGKSFTSRHSAENPLSNYQAPTDSLPTIALLHCEVGSSLSAYAPVSLGDLSSKNLSAWILGHIHRPQILSERPLILYPGAIQGMDPGETGPHGPWIIEVKDDLRVTARQFPLAPLRYERLDISLESAVDDEAAQQAVFQALFAWLKENASSVSLTEFVSWRLKLTGRTSLHRNAASFAERLRESPVFPVGAVTNYIECAIDRTQPNLALEDLSALGDPAGIMARILRGLESDLAQDEVRRLITGIRRQTASTLSHRYFAGLAKSELSDEELIDYLKRAGYRILDLLLSQKEDAL